MSWRNLTVDSNYNITLVRGDSASFDVPLVTVNEQGEETPYIPQGGERLRFALSNKYGVDRSGVLILKDIPINTMILKLEPEDTKPLKFATYHYDIEFTDVMGDVTTVLEADFTIEKEVY